MRLSPAELVRAPGHARATLAACARTTDPLGRVSSISEGATVIGTYSYLGPDLLAEKVLGDGSVATFDYDLSGRPTGVSGSIAGTTVQLR